MTNYLYHKNAEGSPKRYRSPEPPLLITGLFYSGADMIRRKLVGGNNESPKRSNRMPADRNQINLSRQEKRALRSLRLVEKVESIGLENIMHASSNYSPAGIPSLSVRTRILSPMSQLTSLKNITQQHLRNDDPYAVDRETIKAVLNKGLSHESHLSDITTSSTTSSITHLGDSSDTIPNCKNYTTIETSQNKGLSEALNSTEMTKTPQKVKQMQRQKSRRSLINGGGSQRPDLGTVGSISNKTNITDIHRSPLNQSTKQTQQFDSHDDDRSSVASAAPQQSYTQSFVGSISSLFFGRKGGLL